MSTHCRLFLKSAHRIRCRSRTGRLPNACHLPQTKVVIPIPTPAEQYQKVQAGVTDSKLTREATGLLREFSTPLPSITAIVSSSRLMSRAVRRGNASTRNCFSSVLPSTILDF